ncbi:MAG: hypothetical protein ACI9QC_000220 [Oceanicoccus sp.]|jgi:hypothetical protein
MANHATTDEIVKAAWNASKKHWKEFILLPLLTSIAFLLLIAVPLGLFEKYGAPSYLIALLFSLGLIAAGVFMAAYFAAQAKWCEEIHKGAKSIDVQEGLKFGLSRFWGLIGTLLITGVKIILWMMLLVLPGYYKALMYSKSIYVSVLDGVSGGDANRISEAIVNKAGPIRAFSNKIGVTMLGMLAMYLLLIFSTLFAFFFGLVHEVAGVIALVVIGGASYAFSMTVMMLYFHFEYLYFRDEAKAEVAKLKKALS